MEKSRLKKEVRDDKSQQASSSKFKGKKKAYPPCSICKRPGHGEKFCWYRPGVQCKKCREFGHVKKLCKNGSEQTVQAQFAENDQSQEEILFMATAEEFCGAAVMDSSSWLLDSGCTHHMTSDVSLYKSLDKNYSSKVELGNGEFVEVKGKGVAAVQTTSGIKYIQDVLYVPDIS